MKKLIIAIICILVYIPILFSQGNIENVLAEIEKNNTRLLALRQGVEVKKIGNKTGISLQNPEFEFNYLWGNQEIGDRTDVAITQTFDFPTAYRYKNQISDIRNEQVELEYRRQHRDLILHARLICFDLVYQNALMAEMSKRLTHAQSIADSYKLKYEIGETNILEYNKAHLNLLNFKIDIKSIEIDREALLSELTGLNGGTFIEFTDSVFQSPKIPIDFENWFVKAEQNNPVLNWLYKEIEVSFKQEQFAKAKSLPKFQAGYMSESIVGEKFRGVTFGMSIPLWENRNSVKYARANEEEIEKIAINTRVQFYNKLKALHSKATSLQFSANDYRKNLALYDNSELFKKAFDRGEITIIEYILELSFYYQSLNKLLELEREQNKAIAELNQFM